MSVAFITRVQLTFSEERGYGILLGHFYECVIHRLPSEEILI